MAAIDAVLECLNSAYAADPQAIRALCINRVPCNAALANNKFIPVDIDPTDPENDEKCMAGAMGIVNGVLTALGLPLVAMKWSEPVNEQGNRKLLGFVAYQERTDELVQPCSHEPARI